MNRSIVKPLLIIIATCILSCETDNKISSPGARLKIFTDKATYHNEWVVFSAENLTTDTAYLKLYQSAFRERLVYGQWQFWSNQIYGDATQLFMTVPPGGTGTDSVFTAKPGTYRIGFPVEWSGESPSIDSIYSNPFTIY